MTVKKDSVADIQNKKYLDIVVDIVKDNQVAKLIKWVQ